MSESGSLSELGALLRETSVSSRAPKVAAYFITGTGRCGTMLLSQLLSEGIGTVCNHEHSVPTLVMKDAFYRGDHEQLLRESLHTLGQLIGQHGDDGRSYGECSSHLFLMIPELARQLGRRGRFALLVRRPDTFVGSALARGFFDPTHPRPCEHVRPSPLTDVGRRWLELSPFEKCLWYWHLVNKTVLEAFDQLPAELTRVIRMEDLGVSEIERLYSFLGISGRPAQAHAIRKRLDVRVNASPGQGDDRELNPWSQRIALPNISGWSTTQRDALLERTGPLARRLYPEWMLQEFGSE